MEEKVDVVEIEKGLTIWEDGYVKMSENFFWKAVGIINWEWLSANDKNVDKDMFKFKLLKKYDAKVWGQVKKVQTSKYCALKELLYSYDKDWRVNTSDDSTWDLCSHVVGLGREAYVEAFQNPESLIERGRTRNYKENFGYWIPADDKVNVPNSVDFIDKEN